MVNKKLKKKTKWHPLSLAGGQDTATEKQVDDPNKSRIPFKMEWKISHNTGENAPHYRNSNSNSFNNATNSSTSSSQNNNNHHNYRFEKRASSNKSYSKSHHGHHNGYSSTNTTGGNSYNKFGKQEHHHSHKDFPKKVQFNEDEYTRITTPRQDVLFKKGYLSRPKTQPVTPTHQPYNNVPPLDTFYPGYISADSPPLAINGGLTSPNGTEFPFIPAGHGAFMNDALNNVYGNPVFFMPYPDVYYPPTTSDLEMGDQYNIYNNNQYSPPLIEENDGSVSQPVTSTTSTNCSEESESSEEVTTTTAEPVTPSKDPTDEKTEEEPEPVSETLDPTETDTKTEENNEAEVLQPTTTVSPVCYENGYESINPYLNPYAPVYYYPMSFYPVSAMSPYSPTDYYQGPDQETLMPGVNGFPFENGRHNKYPKRRKRYRKTLSSSGTSITDYSEDESMHHENTTTGSGDSGFTETDLIKSAEITEDKRPIAPHTPESINESIAHQSTLNVEVPEFRPKIVLQPTTNGFTNNNNNNYRSNKKTSYNKGETCEITNELFQNKKQLKSNSVTAANRKPLTDKKLSTTVLAVNGETNNVNNNNNSNNNSNTIKTSSSNIKKRATNPVLEKKFLIESTKNIEMQNIDLMKTKSETMSRKEDVKIETTWVVVGGKRKMIQEEIPIEREKREVVERETGNQETVVNRIELVTNGDSPIVTNNVTTKKTSRKSKQKNKTQNKRNVSQGKTTKLQGFVIEEPTFTPTVVASEVIESDIEEQPLQVCTVEKTQDSDTEELLEIAKIEEITWTPEDVQELTKAETSEHSEHSDEKLSDLSEASSTSASMIIVNNINNETEQEKAQEIMSLEDCLKHQNEKPEICDEETNLNEMELDQIKAENILISELETNETKKEAEMMNCSSQINENLVEVNHLNGNCSDNLSSSDNEELPKDIEVLEEIHTKVIAGKNGLSKHLVPEKEDLEAPVEELSCEVNEPPSTDDGNNAAILEVNETQSEKYLLTAAVCNWLHTFNNNDLQSLFTIPLSADFVEKIKYCSEISKYFADDELHNLDKFINENFCKYQQLSASSSLSSLLSDISGSSDDEADTNLTSPHNNTQQNNNINNRSTKATKKSLKLFGCEIM